MSSSSASAPTFLAHLLKAMRYPGRESAHQELLAAALMTNGEHTAEMFVGARCWPPDTRVADFWAQTDRWPAHDCVDVEVSLRSRSVRNKRSRFDIVVRGRDVTAVIECKWGAGTSAAQILQYAEALRAASDRYPNPILVMVTADGAAPVDVARLAAECKMPIVFLSWTDIHPIIVKALGDLQSAIEAPMKEWQAASDAFTTEVLGKGAIALRTVTGDEDADDDDRPDDGAVVTRTTRGGMEVSPTVLERIALLALAQECCAALRNHTKLDWQMRSMPHVGPRGDVQCNIAPTDRALGMLERLGIPAEANDRWSHVVGTYQRVSVGDRTHEDRNNERFDAIRGYAAKDDDVRLRASFRLYFAVDGSFHFQFGTVVTPYLISALPKKKRRELNGNLGQIGTFESKKGHWQPGPALARIHGELRDLVSRPAKGWSKSGRDTRSPTMWNTYIEIKGIKKEGASDRVSRIVEAIDAFLKRVE